MKKEKRFIVRKYVMATNAATAIRKEKTIAVDDVFLDDDWNKAHIEVGGARVGFTK